MVKRWQLSTETLRWLSDSWMPYSSSFNFIPQGPEKHHFTLYVCTCFTKPIVLYIKQLTWVCAAIERCLRSRIAPRLFWQLVATCYVCMHMCATVCVSVCARRAPAHIGQQTRGRLSSGSSVRTLLHLCGWMLARSLSSVGQKLYVCMLSSILSWSLLFSCGVFCGTCGAWSLCEWGIESSVNVSAFSCVMEWKIQAQVK